MVQRLEQIIKYLVDNVEMIRHRVEVRQLKPAVAFTHNERLKKEATQAIRQAVEEIIGKDETLYTWDIYGNDPRNNIGTIEIEVVNAINRTRKSLRAEQRANLMKFIEGEKV